MLKHTSLWLLSLTLCLLASIISTHPHNPHLSYRVYTNHYHIPQKSSNYPLYMIIVGAALIPLYLIYHYIMARMRLSQGSVVAISGSCTSRIGKELILTITKNHSCNIVLYGNKSSSLQDLLEEIRSQKPRVAFFEPYLKKMKKTLQLLMEEIRSQKPSFESDLKKIKKTLQDLREEIRKSKVAFFKAYLKKMKKTFQDLIEEIRSQKLKVAFLKTLQGLMKEIISQKLRVSFFESYLKTMKKTEEAVGNTEQERKCDFYQVDFSNKDTIRMALAQTMAQFGRIDTFIHIAEESEKKDFEDYTPEEVYTATETHFLGPAYMIKEVLGIMQRQSKGQIAYIPMQIGDLRDLTTLAYDGGKSDLFIVCQRLKAGLRKSKSAIKVTVARSDLIVGQDKREVSMKQIKDGVKKMYHGILYQQSIRKTRRR